MCGLRTSTVRRRICTPKNASLSSEPYVAGSPPLTFFFPETKPSGLRKVGVVLVLLVVVVERTNCLTITIFFPLIILFWGGILYRLTEFLFGVGSFDSESDVSSRLVTSPFIHSYFIIVIVAGL